jgi:C4-dicarboxylate-specific signal transduction histidine kinase
MKGELELTTRSARNKFIMVIKDNGCGISKQNLKKIFTPFFTQRAGGLGVGLSATSDILRSNHVRINVKSKEERALALCFCFKIRTVIKQKIITWKN